jgi:hypothetical protein
MMREYYVAVHMTVELRTTLRAETENQARQQAVAECRIHGDVVDVQVDAIYTGVRVWKVQPGEDTE